MVMTENLAHILVFKTNIDTDMDKHLIGAALSPVKEIEEWSVDMEDIDRVLRVVSYDLRPEEIIKTINAIGFSCQELSW